jgi:hypothetical protein
MSASVSTIHRAELAVRSSSSRTIRGSTATRAGRKKIETVVMRKASGKTSRRFVIAAMGISRTSAARRRSLTIMTSRWSQRSTKVPAIGLNRRFGSVAAKNTAPRAIGELFVRLSTRKARAI